jgi:hypothetical protein
MARMKEIEVGIGLSVEVNGAWYRPNCTVKIEMDETDTPAKREAIFKRAWETVTEQIDKTISQIETATAGNVPKASSKRT